LSSSVCSHQFQKGRKCEIDAINGVVCESGKEHEVPTPINDMVVEIVKKKELGELKVTVLSWGRGCCHLQAFHILAQ
jgi:ketopantoate reductase